MLSSTNRSSTRVGRVFVGVVLALLSIAIFAGLEAWGAGPADVGRALSGPSTMLTAADSGREAGELHTLDLAALGREAVRVMTTMIAAVFERWRQPLDAVFDWVDGIHRGWTAVHRFPRAVAPRS
jgi:hypothetical protein